MLLVTRQMCAVFFLPAPPPTPWPPSQDTRATAACRRCGAARENPSSGVRPPAWGALFSGLGDGDKTSGENPSYYVTGRSGSETNCPGD